MSSGGKMFYVSTEHARYRDPTNSRYSVNLDNTIHADKTVALIPSQVSVPNIFPNVNKYRNSWSETTTGSTFTHSLPLGQYNITTLLSAMNSAATWLHFDVTSSGFVTVSIDIAYSGFDVTLTAGNDFLELLGFQDQSPLVVGDGSTVTASTLPNLGGEKVVFVVSDRMAVSNCVNGGDGKLYDTLCCVSMHNTDFGQTAVFRATDGEVDGIKFNFDNDMTAVEIELVDSKFRPLVLPNNYHVRMILKIVHSDF